MGGGGTIKKEKHGGRKEGRGVRGSQSLHENLLQMQSNILCYRDNVNVLCYRDNVNVLCYRDNVNVLCYSDRLDVLSAYLCFIDFGSWKQETTQKMLFSMGKSCQNLMRGLVLGTDRLFFLLSYLLLNSFPLPTPV